MAFTNTEALVVFAVIKELEAKGVNVDYIRNIGQPIMDSFNLTEEQVEAQLDYIKANPIVYPEPVVEPEPIPEPTPEPVLEEPEPEPEPEPVVEEPEPEEPVPEELPIEDETNI